MKNILLLPSFLLITLFSYGQAQEGTVEYQKKRHAAAVIELPYPPSVVNAAMNEYLSKKGRSKANEMKGFTTYRNTQAVHKDSSNADLYFKTERKSRQQKEMTIVSLLLMPIDAEVKTENLHYLGMVEGKNYLNGLAAAIEDYDLELSIKAQNNELLKAEAKFKKLTDEANDLEKKRAVIDRKIADNKNDQQQQLKEIENQKQKLAQQVSLRKS